MIVRANSQLGERYSNRKLCSAQRSGLKNSQVRSSVQSTDSPHVGTQCVALALRDLLYSGGISA